MHIDAGKLDAWMKQHDLERELGVRIGDVVQVHGEESPAVLFDNRFVRIAQSDTIREADGTWGWPGWQLVCNKCCRTGLVCFLRGMKPDEPIYAVRITAVRARSAQGIVVAVEEDE